MIPHSYAVYQSEKAMEDFHMASQMAPDVLIYGHYISEETAAANLELAILYCKAYMIQD